MLILWFQQLSLSKVLASASRQQLASPLAFPARFARWCFCPRLAASLLARQESPPHPKGVERLQLAEHASAV
jgi:hypothetical protein